MASGKIYGVAYKPNGANLVFMMYGCRGIAVFQGLLQL